MSGECVVFWLLLALVLRNVSEYGGVGAALYPTLSPKAGLLLSHESACHQDTLQFQRALKNRTLWAARMMDASARVVVGGLWGARFQLGSFDGCLSAGAVSPVGARYCLAALSGPSQDQPPPPPTSQRRSPRPHPYGRQHPQTVACDDFPVGMWDHVTGLDPHLDAQLALQGCGLTPGSIPLSDVLVALCVPAACEAPALQAALQAALARSATGLQVHVDEQHCVSHAELQVPPWGLPLPALLFWSLVAALSAAVVLAPDLGWPAWDWRTHLRALSLPEAPLAGLDLNVVSGIRAVNMVLLVGVHRAFNTARLPTSNQMINTAESRTSPWHALGHHAALLVDTCFFMSGLLMSLSMTLGRRQEPLRVLANRYLRLTPPYALVMLFYATAMESLGSGPLWKATTVPEAAACRRWWWTNLLYVNNYVHGERGEYGCMLQTWSLAVDMQQLVLGTLLLSLSHVAVEKGRPSDWPVLATGVVTVALPFVATLEHGWPPMLVWSGRALQNPFAEPMFYGMYAVTHMRAAPYIVGWVAGRAMLRIKDQGVALGAAASAWLTWGSASVMLAVMLSSVAYGDLSQPPRPPLEAALYASLSPAVWAAALGTLIVSLTSGPHSAVVGLLRWQPLVTLSRLSYGVYLVHFAVQLLQGGAERNPQHVTVSTVFRSGFSDMIISLIISLWLYLAVEAPMRHLAKMVLAKKCDKKTVT